MNVAIGAETERPLQLHPLYSRISAFYDLAFLYFLNEGNAKGCKEIAKRKIDRVLEVGIGTGFSLDHYQAGSDVIGVDINAAMLVEAQKRAAKRSDLKVELKQMDALNLEFEDSSFDCVFMPSVLTVVPNAERAVSEAVRVLKSNGTLIAICHLAEQSKLPAPLSVGVDKLTRKLFGFTMLLSENIFRDQPELKILSVEPTNFIALYRGPLSAMVTAIKK